MTDPISISGISNLITSNSSEASSAADNTTDSGFNSILQSLESDLEWDASLTKNTILSAKISNIDISTPGTLPPTVASSSTPVPDSVTVLGTITETHEIDGKTYLENDEFDYAVYGKPLSGEVESVFGVTHPHSDYTNQIGDLPLGATPVSTADSNPQQNNSPSVAFQQLLSEAKMILEKATVDEKAVLAQAENELEQQSMVLPDTQKS